MLGGIDCLDAIAGSEMRVEIGDRCPPDTGPRGDIGLAAHQSRRKRRHVPSERERHQGEHRRQRPPAAKPDDQQHERHSHVAEPGDVLSDARRHEINGDDRGGIRNEDVLAGQSRPGRGACKRSRRRRNRALPPPPWPRRDSAQYPGRAATGRAQSRRRRQRRAPARPSLSGSRGGRGPRRRALRRGVRAQPGSPRA